MRDTMCTLRTGLDGQMHPRATTSRFVALAVPLRLNVLRGLANPVYDVPDVRTSGRMIKGGHAMRLGGHRCDAWIG